MKIWKPPKISIKTFYFIFICTHFLCLSCSKQEANPGEELNDQVISWYESQNYFQPLKLDQIKINPPHRSGPNKLESRTYSDLFLTIWVPSNSMSPLPVIIYSHGGGSRETPGESGAEWGKALSSAGYAVIAMHHMKRSAEDVQLNICGELDVLPTDCDLSIYQPYYESTDRPQDAKAVMDNLDNIGKKVGYVFDKDKIIIMGFSGGTNTTHYLSGGVRNAIFGYSNDVIYFSLDDPRPKAFIGMSPGAGTQGGWMEQSLNRIEKPFLCATGFGDLSADLRAAFFDQLSGNDQYRIYVNNPSADHATFNLGFNGNNEDRMNQEIFHQWLKSISIAFLDAHIYDKEEAKSWLKSQNVSDLVHETLTESTQIPTWSYR
jgi:predicted dienelactone hydrolase